MNKIKIIDSPMGFGKTSYLIQKINNSSKDEKFIYITPFLDEVDRVIDSCKSKKFVQPNHNAKNGSKLESLKKLVSNGKNVVSTHALLSYADEELIKIIKSQGYILILDEVMDVVENANIKQSDIDMLFRDKKIDIEEPYKKVIWLDEKYDGDFNSIRNMAYNESLYYVNNKLMVWTLPVSVFNSFQEVYILTYMFDCQIQKYYYDYFNLEYEYYHIANNNGVYSMVETENSNYDYEFKVKAKSLIKLLDNDKLNAIGDSIKKGNRIINTQLSKSWYNSYANDELGKILKNNMYNFFFNICKGNSSLNMWTSFKDYSNTMKGKGYSKGFIPLNSRATNQYSHKINCAYVINRYLNPFYKAFFYNRNIEVDEDRYALSEMLQWIWRSAIRNGQEINLYIPSERMRNLLINFLNTTNPSEKSSKID